MKTISTEEFADILFEAKQPIAEAAEENGADVTLTIEGNDHAFSDSVITITEDDILVPVSLEVGDMTDIRMAAAEDAENDRLASVIAVVADALEIELDSEHVILPETLDEDAILDRAEWFLTNGIG